MSIFHKYDIRGVYPKDISDKDAYNIGCSMAVFFKAKKVIVGRDGRLSSPSLSKNLIDGLLDSGVDVIDIGIVSSPMLYWTSTKMKLNGVMVTASHNPKQYNGFKCTDKNGMMIYYGSGLEKVEKIFNKGKFKKSSKEGMIVPKMIVLDYVAHLFKKFHKVNFGKLKVIVDFSNGAGSVVKHIFDLLKITHWKLSDQIDGKFPDHGANPLKSVAIKNLKNEVLKRKADLGVIFDGDADRVMFIDEKGQRVAPDITFLILAKEELRKKKGTCYYDLRFSKVVEEEIKKAEGKAKMLRVGNPFYKHALSKDKNALIAGEFSGHIMYKEEFGIDAGVYASLKFLSAVARSKEKLSKVADSYSKYFASDETNFKVKDKDGVLKKIEKKYAKFKIKRIDGISVYGKDFWFNVRKSNTEPVIRMRAEADTKKRLREMMSELKRLIR